jgi:hypothetical protein
MDLINQTYLDRVERIDGAQVADNGDIICAATDGRKALAVRVTDDGIDIKLRGAQARSPQFAAAPGQKKKQCKTGISCGASCISATKTCSKKTTPRQKAQKQKIVADAKAEPSPGQLATTKKPEPKEENKEPKGRSLADDIDDIDNKFASPDPSDADVDNWVKERSTAAFKDDEGLAINETNRRLREKFSNSAFAARAKDAKSYALARYADGQKDIKGARPGFFSIEERLREIESHPDYPNPGDREKRLKALEKKVAKGFPPPKAAELKEFGLLKDHALRKNEREEQARRDIDERKRIRDTPKEAQLDDHRKEYEAELQIHKDRQRQRLADIDSLKDEAITDLELEVEDDLLGSLGGNKNKNKALKEYLIQRHAQGGGYFKGVEKTKKGLQKHYRETALKLHPDKGGDPAKFIALNNEYERLLKHHE